MSNYSTRLNSVTVAEAVIALDATKAWHEFLAAVDKVQHTTTSGAEMARIGPATRNAASLTHRQPMPVASHSTSTRFSQLHWRGLFRRSVRFRVIRSCKFFSNLVERESGCSVTDSLIEQRALEECRLLGRQ
jgi:hypothetical protein